MVVHLGRNLIKWLHPAVLIPHARVGEMHEVHRREASMRGHIGVAEIQTVELMGAVVRIVHRTTPAHVHLVSLVSSKNRA